MSLNNHTEEISYPWFQRHNLNINWVTGEVSFDCRGCQDKNFNTSTRSTVVAPVQVESQGPDLTTVPTCYDLGEVFSKSKAASLPPHRPYDGFLP